MPAHGNDLITQLCSPPALACHFTPLQSSLHHLTSSLDLKLNRLQALLHTSAMARPLRSFCLHRIRSGGGSAAPTAAPPSICGAKEGGSSDGGSGEGKSLKGEEEDEEAKKKGGSEAVAVVVGRKVMVAADGGSEEARTALHWALSHAVRPCDTLVLLDVVRGGGGGSSKNRRDPRGCQHLEAMRSICQAKRPEIQGKRCQAQAAQSELRSQAKMATDSRVGGWGHVAEHHQRVPCPRQTGSWPSISSFDSDCLVLLGTCLSACAEKSPCFNLLLFSLLVLLPGARGAFPGGREGPGPGDRGGGEEARRVAARRRPEEAVRQMVAAVDVDGQRQGRGQRQWRRHKRCRLLRPACCVHGARRPAEEPARRRLPHHHQAAEGFLAPGVRSSGERF
ncbi:hypothetical protein PVAP13_3NG229000 [Panicum virgatum]|uniref:UspA domain-containing protein n=1 Tax=Panicum virgatum TaxID=38727 RepID=A0A8T0UEA6_PANVG|nr:hypothetical protein PVAP13_3NG229000 [Panicum virgatum]